MTEIINGEFRRISRKRKQKPLGAASNAQSVDIPLGVQAWEYLHQGQVQTENVILTGTNAPNAMENNVFYQMEQDARQGADAAAAAAQQVLNSGTNWLTLAAIAFVLFNVLTAGR